MKKMSKQFLFYELRNLVGNWYIPFFGVAFPIFFSMIIGRAVLSEVPKAQVSMVATSIMLSFLNLLPLAVVFLGHCSLYSQELEKRIPLRMQLFGYSPITQVKVRMLALMVFFTVGLGVDMLVMSFTLKPMMPNIRGFFIVVLFYYLMGAILFMLAHGIANFFRRFGPAYGVSMTLYFGFMVLGGMMGIRVEQLPEMVKPLARLLPFSYAAEDFVKIWQGKPYNYAPLLQSMLFLCALSAIVMLLSFRYRKTKAY